MSGPSVPTGLQYTQIPDNLPVIRRPRTQSEIVEVKLPPPLTFGTLAWQSVGTDRLPVQRNNTLRAMDWFFTSPIPIPTAALLPVFMTQPNPQNTTNHMVHTPKGWVNPQPGVGNMNGGRYGARMLQFMGVSIYDQNGILRPIGATGNKTVTIGVFSNKGEALQNPPSSGLP